MSAIPRKYLVFSLILCVKEFSCFVEGSEYSGYGKLKGWVEDLKHPSYGTSRSVLFNDKFPSGFSESIKGVRSSGSVTATENTDMNNATTKANTEVYNSTAAVSPTTSTTVSAKGLETTTAPKLLSTTPSSRAPNGDAPVAKAKSGVYLGYWSETDVGIRYASFSGIRYVKAMTPENRFKWAELVDDSTEEFNATEEGPECPQWNIHRKSFTIVGHEDCLFMNIYTPKVEGRYPVMVVIPCGHFVFDSSSRELNGPDYFMNTQQIVMVIFNYRLGPLGYSDFSSEKYPANLGMKDQVLALQWVQKNIAAFGGDPTRVTLQGTSSGAVSVHYHMMSPLSRGLFHAGISESGTALDPWSLNYPIRARSILVSVASKTNCEWAVPSTFHGNADSLAECFRNRTAQQLLAATRHFDLDLVQVLFIPVRETTKHKPFLPIDPYIAPENPLPWLSGQNSDETGAINPLKRALYWPLRLYLSSVYFSAVPYWLNYQETASDPWNVSATILYHYTRSYQPQPGNLVSHLKQAGEDGIFWNPHYMSMLKHRGKQYAYLFSYRETTKNGSFLYPDRGVTHSREQFYLFIKQGVDIQKQNPPADANMSRTLVNLWVNFVKYHKPTPDGDRSLPKWELWTPKNNLYYRMGQDSIEMIVDPKLESYRFWRSLPFRDKMQPFPYYPSRIEDSTATKTTYKPKSHRWKHIPLPKQSDASIKSLSNIAFFLAVVAMIFK